MPSKTEMIDTFKIFKLNIQFHGKLYKFLITILKFLLDMLVKL